MTDAGFRNTWFRLIAAQGWQWLGRVRNRDFVRKTEVEDWQPAKLLYQQARTVAADLGGVIATSATYIPWLTFRQVHSRIKGDPP